MSKIPDDLRYTEQHEYIKSTQDKSVVQVGITDYAQGELGDVVYVELPKPGTTLKQGDVFGTIEAVKAVSELFAPAAGTVVEVNGGLEGDPALVNREPYDAGWMITLRLANPGELDKLLSSSAYKQHIGE